MGDPPRKRLNRYEVPGDIRFLTFSCNQRLQLFNNWRIKMEFVRSIEAARQLHGFQLFAWVIMPEHVHLVLMPNPECVDVAKILWALKKPFSQRVLCRWRKLGAPILDRIQDPNGKPHFWLPGGGYDSNIEGPRILEQALVYVNANPESRGLVRCSTDWIWSSARWYAGGEGPELLLMDPPEL
jgi:putative transposase